MKLGRKYPTKAKLQLHRYLGLALSPPPCAVDWALAMSAEWGVMKNDLLGDCTCAAMGHAVQVISANGDGLITPSDDDIVNMYRASGYNPSDPNSDQGWTEAAAMAFMCDRGLAGIKLDAFADVDQTNVDQVKQAIYLFGGVYIGVMITQGDMDAFKQSFPWVDTDVDSILGGHALWAPSYDEDQVHVITWGKIQAASWNWFKARCDEAHVCLFWPWVQNSVDCSPDGFNLQQLMEDLNAL